MDSHAPLRVGYNPWPGYAPMTLARDLGYFDEREIQIVELSSTSQAMRLFREGMLEAIGVTLDEAINMRAQGMNIVIVLAFNYSDGADALLARPGIDQVEKLKGARIAVENEAVGAYLLARFLENSPLKLTDMVLVPSRLDSHLDIYRRGEVDAIITFEPALGQIEKAGARRLFDSRNIAGEIVDVLAVRRDALRQHGLALRHLTEGHFRALQYIQTHRDEAYPRLAALIATPVEDVPAAYAGLLLLGLNENRHLLAGSEPRLCRTAQQFARIMLEQRLIERDPGLNTLCTAAYLPAQVDKGVRP